LAFDALAAFLWIAAPQAIARAGRFVLALRDRPSVAVVGFIALTILCYVPLRLAVGDAAWLAFGPIPIQTSRILLYASSFFVGVAIGAADLRHGLLAPSGAFARKWLRWLSMAMPAYGTILLLVYLKHSLLDETTLPLWFEIVYALAFAIFSAAMACTLLALMLRFAHARMDWLDRLRPSAYGIYLVHYIFIIWLQYAVFDFAWPAGVKFAIVFAGTLLGSWSVTLLLRQAPVMRRMI
jgi:surface polysaccharide O-acyltransferase-like enzyme